MKKAYAAAAALALCLSLGTAALSAEPAKPETGVMKGQKVPDFSLKDISGKSFSLSSAKNNVVCLLFWATWCPYCVHEVPRFKELHAKFSAKGFRILGIDIGVNDPLPRVEAFQLRNQLPYTILYDSEQEVSRMFYVTGIPVTVIIDKKGIIQYRGYQLPENIEQLITQLL